MMKAEATHDGWHRVEDEKLLRGAGRFTDDLAPASAAHGCVLRSPHAAAEIRAIEVAAALALPGVLAVYTAADLAADGIGGLPTIGNIANRDGSMPFAPPRPVLAEWQVRHVGDPVAFVVATDAARAQDGAEAVRVDYAALPAVTDPEAAVAAGAPPVWPEALGNRAFDWETGRKDETDALFAAAAHVTRVKVVNNRLVAVPIEPRAAWASYDVDTGCWTLWTSTQGSWLVRDLVAGPALKVEASRLRVVTPDVGGSFGSKIFPYPEHVLVCHAARRLSRPVRWCAARSETFLADAHGRDSVARGELALDAEHRFLALRAYVTADMGAYLSTFAPLVPTAIGTSVLPSVYRFRAVYAHVVGVFTHTVPVDAYRGAGMPESIYLVERLVDAAAAELGLDRADLRRRNLVQREEMPYTAALGSVYDSGDFGTALDAALERSGWPQFPERRAAALARGRHRGIGIACYLATTGGPPTETAAIRFSGGGLELRVGTQASGQGHATAFSRILTDRLGVPASCIEVVQGDTDLLAAGGGTGGSRSLYAGGAAVAAVVVRVIEQGRVAAAKALQATTDEVVFRDGRFGIAWSERGIDLLALAALEEDAASGCSPLDSEATAATGVATFPNGCHVAEVEVDPETGVVVLERYVAVDDVGRVLDRRLAAGQIHGGIVQGIGQALCEQTVFAPGSGQLLTGSLMDYALPRAADLPPLEIGFVEVPCATNPLGTKGAGEAGAVASAPAVVNAVLDALAGDGVHSLDMPLTPERVWEALRRP